MRACVRACVRVYENDTAKYRLILNEDCLRSIVALVTM